MATFFISISLGLGYVFLAAAHISDPSEQCHYSWR